METLQQKHEVMQMSALEQAIRWAGSQTKLAKILGVSRVTVSSWVQRGRMAATSAERLEEITDGLFNKRELRPDVVKWWKEGEVK